jgi:hypothetical protein
MMVIRMRKRTGASGAFTKSETRPAVSIVHTTPHHPGRGAAARDMRDFDIRVDRLMEQTKKISSDLRQIGKK